MRNSIGLVQDARGRSSSASLDLEVFSPGQAKINFSPGQAKFSFCQYWQNSVTVRNSIGLVQDARGRSSSASLDLEVFLPNFSICARTGKIQLLPGPAKFGNSAEQKLASPGRARPLFLRISRPRGIISHNVHESVLDSQLHHKNVNSLCTMTEQNNKSTILWGR